MEQWSQSLALKSEFAALPLNYMYMALVLGKSMTLLISNFNFMKVKSNLLTTVYAASDSALKKNRPTSQTCWCNPTGFECLIQCPLKCLHFWKSVQDYQTLGLYKITEKTLQSDLWLDMYIVEYANQTYGLVIWSHLMIVLFSRAETLHAGLPRQWSLCKLYTTGCVRKVF